MRFMTAAIAVFVLLLTTHALADGGFSYEYELGRTDDAVGLVFFTPGRPPSDEAFAVSVIADGCTQPGRNPDDLLSEVRSIGERRIAVLISAAEVVVPCLSFDPPPPPQRFTQRLPGLDAGSWAVELFLFDPSSSFPEDLSSSDVFASGVVVVGGQLPARAIPVLSAWSVSILTLIVALIGLLRVRPV